MTLFPLTGKAAPARDASPVPLSSTVEVEPAFQADFSRSEERGVGVRVQHLYSGRYLDLRLAGYPPRPAALPNEGQARFKVSENIDVLYEETAGGGVKETIILSDRSTSSFRFKIKAPGLFVEEIDGHLVFHAPDYPEMFRMVPPVAWDADGKDIPVTSEWEEVRILLKIDEGALAGARLPVTIDPDIIVDCSSSCRPLEDGGGGGGGGGLYIPTGTDGRRLFETFDGKLLYFYGRPTGPDSAEIVYTVSSDDGATWAEPELVGNLGIEGNLNVTQVGDDFLVAYTNGVTDSVGMFFRRLTRLSSGWEVGPERTVNTGGVTKQPQPNAVDLGKGPSGSRYAIGFTIYDSLLSRFNYVVSFSEDDGANWGPSTLCKEDIFRGTLALQGERLWCITPPKTSASGIEARQWLDIAFGTPLEIPISYTASPSTVVTDDGRLHLVASENLKTYHTFIEPEGASFAAPVLLGDGSSPVISTKGTSLHVYASQFVSSHETRILPYIATDGENFHPVKPLFGDTFDHVLDYNETWDFSALQGDALFSFTDGNSTFGNRTGTDNTYHRLDDPDKELAFSFPVLATKTVTDLRLYFNYANWVPDYRFGIQEDCSVFDPSCVGEPSGRWVDEVRFGDEVISGAYWDGSPPSTGGLIVLPETELQGGKRYHIVVAPIIDPTGLKAGPGPDRWLEIGAVATAEGAEGDMKVFDGLFGSWTAVPAEVPRFRLWGVNGDAASQKIAPNGYQRAHRYSVPAERFVAPVDLTPTSVALYLGKSGSPSPPTLRLLNSRGGELWSAVIDPPSDGWATIAMSGVDLTSGQTYILALDDPDAEFSDSWGLPTSGDPNGDASWNGDVSTLVEAEERPGFGDRTLEAKTSQGGDFTIFNSGSLDALYLGSAEPFDFTVLMRETWSSTEEVSMSWSYWDGAAWSPLPVSRDQLLQAGSWGDAEWVPPNNWQLNSVDGRVAYWVRLQAAVLPTRRISIARASAVRDSRSPTTPPRAGGDFIPLAYLSTNGDSGIGFHAYDATPPFVMPQHLVPRDGGNAVFSNQKLMARITDSLGTRTIDRDSIVFELTDLGSYSEFSYAARSWDVGSGWAVTDDVPLVPGRSYAIKVSVRDLFGNSSVLAHERGFLSTAVSAKPGSAEIARTTCQLSAESSNGEREVTCPNVQLNVSGGDVAMTGTRHIGNGYVSSQIDLSSATISTEQNGELLEVPAFPAGTRASLERTFTASQISSQSESYALTTGTVSLGDVVQSVPESWSSAVISLSGQMTTETPDLCSDPSLEESAWHSPICTPDPIADPFLVTLREDTPDLDQVAAAIASTSQMGVVSSKGVRLFGHVSPTQAKEIRRDERVASVIEVGFHRAIDIWGEPDSAGTCRWHTLQAGGGADQAISLDFDPRGIDCGPWQPSSDFGALIVTTNNGQIGGGGGGGGGGGACLSPMHFSASHEIKDPPQQTLVWLRAYAKAHTDCTYVWWDTADMRVRTGKSRTEQFSGDPLCWWMADPPTASADFSTTKKEVTAEFQGWYHVRKPPPYWDSSCTADAWLPIVWSGAQCDVMIWGEVYATPHSIRWTTDKAFYETDPTGFSCSNFLNSRTSTSSDGNQWTGYPEDNCVAIKPSGNEDVACD